MPNARRGEVWLVDLGMTAKVRPAVICNTPFRDEERALFAIVPHTTALHGGRFEVAVKVAWLEDGAFDAQGCATFPVQCSCAASACSINHKWNQSFAQSKSGWKFPEIFKGS